MKDLPVIRGGKYRHYKGNIYKVTGIAHSADTLEEMVVFRAAEGDRQLWVQPLIKFLEKVKTEGKMVPRFEYIGEDND